jgi:hypothetical protein
VEPIRIVRWPAILLLAGLAGCPSESGDPTEPVPPPPPPPPTSPSGVTVTGVSPNPLIEGQGATITGQGFSQIPSNNQVKIDGIVAVVSSATTTTLDIVVPYTGCKPARQVDVQVKMLADPSNVVRHPMNPGALQMSVGEELLAQNPAHFCLQLAGGAQSNAYLIGLQSVSEDISSVTSAVVTGVGAGAGLSTAPLLVQESLVPGAPPAQPRSDQEERLSRTRSLESRLRTEDRELLERPGLRAAGTGTRSIAIPSWTRVGDILPIRVPEFQEQCTEHVAISAVVKYISTRAIFLEDRANSTGGFSLSQYQSMGAAFDNLIYPTETEYFSPASDIDQNGRIAFVVTRQVNRMGAEFDPLFGLAGFVKVVNMVAESYCPSSNEGEIVYLRVPDEQGQEGAPTSDAAAEAAFMPLLIAHEFVHVLQHPHVIPGNPRGGVPQPNWFYEAMATLGEEIVGHRLMGRGPGNNYGFSVAYNTPQLTPLPWYRAFQGLGYYFGYGSETQKVTGAPEQCSWIALGSEGNDGPCLATDVVAYDVGWALFRWMADHYGAAKPGGEKQLMQALIAAPVRGYAALTYATGVPIDALLALWAAALYTDDRVAGLPQILTYTSWNMFDIDNHKLMPSRLLPRERGFGNFSDAVKVRAGSTAYFRVSGTSHGPVAIRLRDPSGALLPSWMRVWIVRLQ